MKRILLLSLCLLLLSGCRSLAVLVINEDGSGTFTSEIEMENRYFKLLSQQGDPIQALEDNANNASFEVETERLDTDKSKGLRASFEFSDVEDLKKKFAELNTEETGGSTLFADAKIEDTGHGWVFETAQEAAPVGGEEGEQILDPEDLKKIIDSKVEVTLPGAKGESNATDVTEDADGGTTTFVFELTPGAAAALDAKTTIPDSLLDKLLGPLGLGILGALLVIGGGLWFLKKRSGGKTQDAEAAAP